MAVRTIDTTIKLDGEQSFKHGLAAMSREMRVLESESRALASGFGSTGDAAAQAAAKQKNLQNQISQQEQIVAALEIAVKKSAKAYGEGSAQADGYAVKLNNARTKLANLQKALSNADREVEELGRDSQKAGTQLSKGIGEGAKDAENDVRSLMETMQDSLDSIKSNTTVMAVKTIWDTASGAYNSVAGFVDGTVEYRRQLSFLQVNADKNGFDFTDIKDKLTEVTGLTGDASASIEGLSNLMAVPGMDSDTLTRAINGLSGAVISFPDTVKFESLADSLQETLASGEATGQFAELLSRMGLSTEDFNKALANSKTQAGDLEIALAYLAAGGMNDVYKKWEQTNGAMVEAAQTKQELDAELSTFAGTMEEYVTTPVRKIAVDAMRYINEIVALAEEKGTEVAWNKISEDFHKTSPDAAGVVDATMGVLAWMNQNLNPLQVYENAKAALAGERTVEETLESLNLFSDKYMSDYQKQGIDRLQAAKEGYEARKTMFPQYYTDKDKENGKQAGTEYSEGFAEGFDTPVVIDEIGAQLAEGMGGGKPLKVVGEKAMAHVLEGIDLEAYYKEMEDAGKEGGEQLAEGFETGVATGDASAATAGAAFGAAYAKGILSQVSYVSSAAAALAAAAAVKAGSAGVGIGSTGLVSGVLNIDGRQAGTFLAPYVSESMAVNVN